ADQAFVLVQRQRCVVEASAEASIGFVLIVSPDLRQMRYFVAVAEHGSFTRAAQELHVAQQAVSQQIRSLEATLGATLLRRSSRKVELTPEGSVFLVRAKRVLAASDRAVRRTQAAARG